MFAIGTVGFATFGDCFETGTFVLFGSIWSKLTSRSIMLFGSTFCPFPLVVLLK